MDADLQQLLNSINSNVSQLHGDLSTGNGYMSNLVTDLGSVDDKLDTLISSMPSSSVDYSGSIQALCKLLSYTDLLLLVILVFLVLVSGMLLGMTVTRWLKARRE